MTFEVRVNGETVSKTDQQVIGVSLMSARGELYRAGISTEGAIDIVLQTVNAGDPIRLDQLERAQNEMNRSLVEGEITGTAPWSPSDGLTAKQQVGDVTLHPGSENRTEQAQTQPPAVDLAQGLTPADHEILTARIDAFNSHGDAQRAINDNPLDESRAQSAEQGAVPQQPETGVGTPSEGVTNTNAPSFSLPTPNESPGAPPPESTPEGNLGSGQGPIPGDASQLDAQDAAAPESTPNEPNPNVDPDVNEPTLPAKAEGTTKKK